MHHIVAVEVTLTTGERRYFLTWGRIQSAVDPKPLAEIVLRNSHIFAIDGEAASAKVLWDPRSAMDTPFFWDAFFDMCQARIPFGRRYAEWKRRIDAQQQRGREIWYLGHDRIEQPDEPDARQPPAAADPDDEARI